MQYCLKKLQESVKHNWIWFETSSEISEIKMILYFTCFCSLIWELGTVLHFCFRNDQSDFFFYQNNRGMIFCWSTDCCSSKRKQQKSVWHSWIWFSTYAKNPEWKIILYLIFFFFFLSKDGCRFVLWSLGEESFKNQLLRRTPDACALILQYVSIDGSVHHLLPLIVLTQFGQHNGHWTKKKKK